jgi:hypothetical protein
MDKMTIQSKIAMKISLPIVIISLILFLNACKSRENKDDTIISSVRVDTIVAQNPESPYDPDPTDTVPGDGYISNASSKQTQALVMLTMRDIFRADIEKNIIDSFSRKFIFFEYDLNDDSKKEILVGTRGPYFCGSGGCTIFILDNQGNVISKFSVAGYPIIIDNNKTNGWKNLFIFSGGKNHIITFNGKNYPSNPSVQPVLKTLPSDSLSRALDFINTPYPWISF